MNTTVPLELTTDEMVILWEILQNTHLQALEAYENDKAAKLSMFKLLLKLSVLYHENGLCNDISCEKEKSHTKIMDEIKKLDPTQHVKN